MIADGRFFMRALKLFLLVAAISTTPVLAQTPKLSLDKIEQLVSARAPDGVVAREIRNRGLDFSPTKATVETMRKKGAGPGTLEALRMLIWQGGRLTLKVNPVDAKVDVAGADGKHYEVAPEMTLAAGSYVIKTFKQNFQPDTRNFVMGDGQNPILSIQLVADPAYIKRTEQSIGQLLRGNNTMEVLTRSRALLEMDPGNGLARSYIAWAHWTGFHGQEFEDSALNALQAGQNVTMKLYHEERSGKVGGSRHDTQFAIMPKGILFDPGVLAGLSCSLRRMEIPYSALGDVSVAETNQREPYLSIKVNLREQAGGFILMKLFLTRTPPVSPSSRHNQFNRLAADAPPESAPREMFETLRNVILKQGGLPPGESPAMAQESTISTPGAPTPGVTLDVAPALPLLAVFPFQNMSIEGVSHQGDVDVKIRNAFSQIKRFTIADQAVLARPPRISRNAVYIDEITGWALEAAGDIGAQYFVVGSYSISVSMENSRYTCGIKLELQMRDVQTRAQAFTFEIKATGREDYRDASITAAIKDLSVKINREVANRFPVKSNILTVVSVEKALIDAGKLEGLLVGDLLSVFEKEPDGTTVTAQGGRKILTEVKVESLEDHAALVVIVGKKVPLMAGMGLETKQKKRGFLEALHDTLRQ